MKYNFKKAKVKKTYCGCKVSSKYVYLSKELTEKMKKDRCNVHIDTSKNVIAFTSQSDGAYKLTKQGSGYIVNCELLKELKPGRYLFEEMNGKNIICKQK